MLAVAVKKTLRKKIGLGVLRATAKVGCTNEYFTKMWFGKGDKNSVSKQTRNRTVRFTTGPIVERIGAILGPLWHKRFFGKWKGPQTQCTFVDIDPEHPSKKHVVVRCHRNSVMEAISKNLVHTGHWVITINFRLNTQ
jgi:hypothetical protein